MKRYGFETTCVSSTAEKIDAMTERARPVALATLRRHCRNLPSWERFNGYATGSKKGLHLKDDWAVHFYKSRYDGVPCYYIEHSSIEHVWTLLD